MTTTLFADLSQKLAPSDPVSKVLIRIDIEEAHQIAIQIQLFTHDEEALAMAQASRPINIKRTYRSKQKE